MEKLKRYFGDLKMTWINVIVFAVLNALVVAVLNVIPALSNTSFTDPATYLDWWFVTAIFVIVNCDKWWEASLKAFLFFLISQPLIYLIEVPFVSLHWQIFMYYKPWFFITLLTLPGGAIAYLLKKKNWLSVIVLAVPNAYFALATVAYAKRAYNNFPHHLLSAIFCFAMIILLTLILLDDKKHKLVEFIISLVALIGGLGLLMMGTTIL